MRIASQQQTQGISQVTQGVAHLEKSTQSTAASAEESAAASEELYAQAQHALGLVLQLEALAGVKDDGAAATPTATGLTWAPRDVALARDAPSRAASGDAGDAAR